MILKINILKIIMKIFFKTIAINSLFKKRNIGIINASGLSFGLLSDDDGGPSQWHPASDDIKSIARLAANYCKVIF